MSYSQGTGDFSFPPTRNESGTTLTLRLFDSNKNTIAMARIAGGYCDPNRRDTLAGSTSATVSTAAQLLGAVNGQVANITLADGTYTLVQPLVLNYPVTINGGLNAVLQFAPGSGNSWDGLPGAVDILSSHTTLNGFKIDVVSAPGSWNNLGTDTPSVIQINNTVRATSITNLTIYGRPPKPGSATEPIRSIHSGTPDVGGTISGNTIQGGDVELRGGPWTITSNDIQGPFPGMETIEAFALTSAHDVLIQNNHAHVVNTTSTLDRFLVMGGSGSESGFHDTVQDNVVDGGLGERVGPRNLPEVILTEGYDPHFEGSPAGISPSGMVLKLPYLRGTPAQAGDVVSVVSGPSAGRWAIIAQLIDAHTYLMDSPLPVPSPNQDPNYAIAITRGYVGETFQRNVIDLSSNLIDNGVIGLKLASSQFGTRVLNNTFIGRSVPGGVAAFEIQSSATQAANSQSENPAPDQWTHLPSLGLVIDGNSIQDTPRGVQFDVVHSLAIESDSGRLYLQGSFTNNAIKWTSGSQPSVIVGVKEYTHQGTGWVDDGELALMTQGNWGSGPSGQAPTMQVYAATINQVATDNQSAIVLPTNPSTLSIDAGGGASGDYLADSFVSGGNAGTPVGQAIDVGGVTDPAPQAVYQSERYGSSFTYTIPNLAPGGTYTVRLHFAETFSGINGEGQRTVNVAINGNHLLSNFDIYKAAGDRLFKAVVRQFTVKADSSGTIGIAFTGGGYGPKVSGIQILHAAIPPNSLSIDAGGGASGDYLADSFVSGGNAGTPVGQAIDVGGVTDPAPQAVYQSERYGSSFTYTIPNLAPGGTYTVRLHFAETFSGINGEGQRTVNVAINGNQALTNFDIYKAAGDRLYRAVVQQFTVVADPSGTIGIAFTGGGYGPKVSGIQILPVIPGAVLINSGGGASGSFGADAYVTQTIGGAGSVSGSTVIDTSGVDDPAPQAVYQSERYGAFTYSVPNLTPGGSYTVRLHFAETFGSINGEGQRLIDVAINGGEVLTNFDVYAAAGDRLDKAVVEQFAASADGTGTITIAFTGSGYGAKSSGIEIIPDQVTKVDLSGSFNQNGISADSNPAAANLDGGGNSYSADLLGTSVRRNSVDYRIGAAGQSNVVQASGQTITLPSGSFSSIRLLGTAINGPQAGVFTVTYSDGSSVTFNQTFSDWYSGVPVAGEAIAKAMAYRNTATGRDTTHGSFYLYNYIFVLDSSKTIRSITLPNSGNIKILAIDLLV